MAVSQSKLQLKEVKRFLRLTAIFADTLAEALQKTSLRFCHALCASDVFIRSYLTHSKLTSQLVLARSLAAFIFCGGIKEAAKALLFVRALFLARLPRNPHTPGSGARGTHSDLH